MRAGQKCAELRADEDNSHEHSGIQGLVLYHFITASNNMNIAAAFIFYYILVKNYS